MYRQQYNPGAVPGQYLPMQGQVMRSYAPPPYGQQQVFPINKQSAGGSLRTM